jgi:hypothetical protein
MGSTPPRAALFIGGPLNLPVAVPFVIQHTPMDLFREVREKILVVSSLIGSSHDLNSEFRSPAGHKLSSGRPDGNQVNKPPRHINLGL